MKLFFRIFGYFIGFMTMSSIMPHPISFKNWCIMTLVGLIFILTTQIFRNN